MTGWERKSLIFRTLDAMPFGSRVHYLLQRKVTREWPRREEKLAALFGCAARFRDIYARHADRPVEEASVLEIGSGRDLVVPLSLRQAGFARVYCTDIEALADIDLVNHAHRYVCARAGADCVPFEDFAHLAREGIHYLAPAYVEDLGEDVQVDYFVSNETLEHIPKDALHSVFRSVKGHLREGAISAHAIDYSDHYARGGGISRFNFYRYDDAAWKKHNSRFQYVNRLRHSEYMAMLDACGFEILEEETTPGEVPGDVRRDLSERFSGYADEDLAILRSTIVCRPARAS